MKRRTAPKASLFLLWFSLTSCVAKRTGGLHFSRLSQEFAKSGGNVESSDRVKRSLDNEDDTKSSKKDDFVPANAMYPEIAIHNLEQTSDKIETDMYRKSNIPTAEDPVLDSMRHKLIGSKAVYNIDNDVSLEVPLTSKINVERIEKVAKRNTIPKEKEVNRLHKGKEASTFSQDGNLYSYESDHNGPKHTKKEGSSKTNAVNQIASRRRDVVPDILSNSLIDPSDEDFQDKEKSADLEIHADSTGVRVKAKPASLQVVSNPQDVVAERRTFTPVLPSMVRPHRRHFHRMRPLSFMHSPLIRRHHFHRRHMLPWLRHRQHIMYPDIFERMRFNTMPGVESGFGSPPFSFSQPLPPMMNAPTPMMPEASAMAFMAREGAMTTPNIQQFLQRSPTMEANSANRFAIPDNSMNEMAPRALSPFGGMSPIGGMSTLGRMGSMFGMPGMNNVGGQMPFMGGMASMGNIPPMNRLTQMESMMGMPLRTPFDQGAMRRKNVLEFWGMPNQDQLQALARGENVQKILGLNRYKEGLGDFSSYGMSPFDRMSSDLGGRSFEASDMRGDGSMGPYSGTSSAMFRGMSNELSNMMGMRRGGFFKKDKINKTDEYKKANNKTSDLSASGNNKASGSVGHNSAGKFDQGIAKNVRSLIAEGKHVAFSEESELHREHRIRKSPRMIHDNERRSLNENHSSKRSSKNQKTKDIRGSKKEDISVHRPPIIYHPPPEVYHRPDIVLHRPPVLFHRPPIVYHQAPVIVHRPPVVYRQSPVIFHRPLPLVSQPIYRAWDNFFTHPALTHIGSSYTHAHNYLGYPWPTRGYKKGAVPRKPKKAKENKTAGSKNIERRNKVPRSKQKTKGKVDKKNKVSQKKKKDVVVNRPPIIYHPPPEIYHRPEIVVHRAPLLIRRPPIIYHQPAVIVHRPPVVYHQPPLIFHQPAPTVNQPVLYSHDNFIVHPSFSATHSGSFVSDAGQVLGIPNTVSAPGGMGFPFQTPPRLGVAPISPLSPIGRRRRSTRHHIPSGSHNEPHESPVFTESDVVSKETYLDTPGEDIRHSGVLYVKRHEGTSADKAMGETDDEAKHSTQNDKMKKKGLKKKTSNAKKKNAIVVKRPPIIYHPPPEVYHRPDIVVHRAPIVIHRSPLVYHQAPVIVHRPAIVYHQPMVVFHQPLPMVNQPMYMSHDIYTPHNTLALGGSTLHNFGVFQGSPPGPYATRKGAVPKNVEGINRNKIPKDSKMMGKKKPTSTVNDDKHEITSSHGHSQLRKLILSSKKGKNTDGTNHSRKQSQISPRSSLELRRPSLFLLNPADLASYFDRSHVLITLPYRGAHSGNPLHNSMVPGTVEVKDTVHVHDFGVPSHSHVVRQQGNSHAVLHHGYVTRHADCPDVCTNCRAQNCPSVCSPHCISIIHHQHHKPHHVFVDEQQEHQLAQTHFHDYHWPAQHHHGRRDTDFKNTEIKGNDNNVEKETIGEPLYKSYKRSYAPCVPNSPTCYHPVAIYHDHIHPTEVYHKHHYHPYPVYQSYEHIKPIVYHHIQPYPVHHHHTEHIYDNWHHYHVLPPKPYPVPIPKAVGVPFPVPIQKAVGVPLPVPIQKVVRVPLPVPIHKAVGVPLPVPCSSPSCSFPITHRVSYRSTIPHHSKEKEISTKTVAKKSNTPKNKKKDVVVNRPPIIYHPPPEVYHRPQIVVHRAPVLIHRPPIVYHQPAVIVHRPPVVYHQRPVVFHQPLPTVNQPVLYSHDNFILHPEMIASHAGTMLQSLGHVLGIPKGPILNYPGLLPGYGGPASPFGGVNSPAFGIGPGLGMMPYGPTFGRKRRSIKEDSRDKKNIDKKYRDASRRSLKSRSAERKNAIVVHRPPFIYHPAPEIYHRPRVVVHRPDVLIHRPPIVFHQSPVVLHRPPVVYHQPPLVFHQPAPMMSLPVYHSHDTYAPHSMLSLYGSKILHGGTYTGVPFGESGGFNGGFEDFNGPFAHGFGRSTIENPKRAAYKKRHKTKSKHHKKHTKKVKDSYTRSEKADRKNSVMVQRPPILFHPPPEVYHRPAYVYHQPDIVVHRPPTVYHQSPVVVHRPPVAYQQQPVIYHESPPLFAQNTYPLGTDFNGINPFAYGKSSVPKHKLSKKKHSKVEKYSDKNVELDTKNSRMRSKNRQENKETSPARKNNIVIHRPPIIYHPPPEIYHRPDVVVHRPDILVHRPSFVYGQPSVVLHRPAVVYHEPDVVFHQPSPMISKPIYYSRDEYAPTSVYEHVGSTLYHGHVFQDVPSSLNYGMSNAFTKSKIENAQVHHHDDYLQSKENGRKMHEKTIRDEQKVRSGKNKVSSHYKKRKGHRRKRKDRNRNEHKRHNLIVHRPPMIYHPSPAIYHRPVVVMHHPDVVIHRPSIVVQPPAVVFHKPAVAYHQPPVVFHEPSPMVNQPFYHSHDAYVSHPMLTYVGGQLESGDSSLSHPSYGYDNTLDFHGDLSSISGDVNTHPVFGKSKIAKGGKQSKTVYNKEKHHHDRSKRKKVKYEPREYNKRDVIKAKTRRVQLPRAQKEKTERGTKKNDIVVRRPPIIYHPPPEVYHRPDIIVHRAPIVIRRAPLVYHQAPVIVHRPAVVYHQPAVVFHQPPPTVHQPIYHSIDTFNVHPQLKYTPVGSNMHEVGHYVGAPSEMLHHFTMPTISRAAPMDVHSIQRRAIIERHISPVTPFNFVRDRQLSLESPRSTIPYPSLYPHSLTYNSFPWGRYPVRSMRSVVEDPYRNLGEATIVPRHFSSSLYHPKLFQRPRVDVNIETIRSKLSKPNNRERRQPTSSSSQSAVHSSQVLPSHSVPRSRRQILASLPLVNSQQIAPFHAYSPNAQPYDGTPLSSKRFNEQIGVYRDLLGAIYPGGTHARPKVNILVQSARSKIPASKKSGIFENSLNQNNVDAFNTMPEVTTIEPPLLRDGVRVNMVHLNDPTESPNSVFSTMNIQRTYDGNENLANYGGNALGIGSRGNFDLKKRKKSLLPKASWRDVNAEKKWWVPDAFRKYTFADRPVYVGDQSMLGRSANTDVSEIRFVNQEEQNGHKLRDIQQETRPQMARPNVNVNIETYKKHDVFSSNNLPDKPRPNSNTGNGKTSKGFVPGTREQNTNNPVHKRQQILRSSPLALALPSLRSRVNTESKSSGYTVIPVPDTLFPARNDVIQPAIGSQFSTFPGEKMFANPLRVAPSPSQYTGYPINPWKAIQRPKVNINVQTAKSNIPYSSKRIITPRFKREFPVLYNIIKAKVKLDQAKGVGSARRDKRQATMMFPLDGKFLQNVIPDGNLLAKRFLYGTVPRYPNSNVLIARGLGPKTEEQPVETRGSDLVLPSSDKLLKNDVSQNFNDFAKMQRHEANAFKVFSSGQQSSPFLNVEPKQDSFTALPSLPAQADPQEFVPAPQGAEGVSFLPQPSLASFSGLPQLLPTSDQQQIPAQLISQTPTEIVPAFVQGKPESELQNPLAPIIQPLPLIQTLQSKAFEFPGQTTDSPAGKKNSFADVSPLNVPLGYGPQFPMSGLPFPFFQMAPMVIPRMGLNPESPYVRSIRPQQNIDRPSVNIQVQTSKSRIPKLKKKSDEKEQKHKIKT